eukprot:scaffold25554_cov70-Phaeocystis_antarctica.AAC.2
MSAKSSPKSGFRSFTLAVCPHPVRANCAGRTPLALRSRETSAAGRSEWKRTLWGSVCFTGRSPNRRKSTVGLVAMPLSVSGSPAGQPPQRARRKQSEGIRAPSRAGGS